MPTATRPDVTPAQVCGSLTGQPGELGAGEVRVEPQARALGDPVLVPASRSSSHSAAVRRSCHTIARRGAPSVSRSQSTAVSRWLVMPTAVGCVGRRASSAARQAARTACQMSSGACSTQPSLREVLGELR